MKLNELNEGQSAVVTKISLSGDIRRRLYDLGLIKGTKVSCEIISPMGNPIAYNIRGAVIALRNSDADKIFIKCQG